ncbi:HAD hydrolase family protein [Pelagibacterales bacterium SAG-MED10]|nr:HAD hydrolase family protein [Pelagibacterales bacterium SAG-MED10]
MTTGQFIYSDKGKQYKIFGPHDSDGLKIIKKKIKINFVTADKRGFLISKKRISKDMGYNLNLVSEEDRYQYLNKKFGIKNIIYMGDGIYDAKILSDCYYGISPKNSRTEAKKSSDFITKNRSAEGAVLDACLHIDKKFFKKI